MGYKCNTCKKFLGLADSVKCTKCSLIYHRVCARISPSGSLPSKWLCLHCKPSHEPVPKMCTPVQATTSDLTEDPEESSSEINIDSGDTSNMIVQELRLLRSQMSSFAREVSFLREEMARLNSIMTEYGSRMNTIENRLDVLESFKNSTSNNESETISLLRTEINDREQDYLLNDIELVGLQEKSGENPIHIVQLIGRKMGVDVDERDIVSAERVGPRRVGGAGRDKPRPLVIRLARRAVRDRLLREARVRRNTDSTDIVEGDSHRFYLNERLTNINRQLFYAARQEAQKQGWRYVWTKGGHIFIRRGPEAKVHRIHTNSDITKFFGSVVV